MTGIKRIGKIDWLDWLLVIGLVMGPMTSLRIWKIGPGETLVFIWCIFQIRNRLRSGDIFRFFFCFLSLQVLGSIWCWVVSPEEVASELFASWFYLGFVSVYMYAGLRKYTLDYTRALFQHFARLSVVWYMFLYLYSQIVSTNFFGAPLWYGTQRFSGGATNPHQVAILMCGLSMWFGRELSYKRNIPLNLACLLGCCFIVAQTKSSTGIMAIFCGVFSWIVFFLAKRTSSRRKRFQMFVFEVLILLLFLVVFYKPLYDAFIGWVASDKNGMGRFYLYSQVGECFVKSPFVGLGPGWHVFSSTGRPVEIHNTYLEVLAGSGLLGFFVFCLFTYRQIKKIVRVDTMFLPIIVSIYAYGFAGFALRKLAYWGVTVFVLVMVEKEYEMRQKAALENAGQGPGIWQHPMA